MALLCGWLFPTDSGQEENCICIFVYFCVCFAPVLFAQAASCPRGFICLKRRQRNFNITWKWNPPVPSALPASGSDSGSSPSWTAPTFPLPLPVPPDLVHPQIHLVFRCSHTIRRAAPLLIGCLARPPAEAFYPSPLFFTGSCAPSMKIHSRIGGEGRKTGFSQSWTTLPHSSNLKWENNEAATC